MFRFDDPENNRNLNNIFYQDNNPKHKYYICRTWLLYNCTKAIDTPAHSPYLKPNEKDRKRIPQE